MKTLLLASALVLAAAPAFAGHGHGDHAVTRVDRGHGVINGGRAFDDRGRHVGWRHHRHHWHHWRHWHR